MLADGLTLYILFGIAIAFAAVNVVSLILAAKDVDQAPLPLAPSSRSRERWHGSRERW